MMGVRLAQELITNQWLLLDPGPRWAVHQDGHVIDYSYLTSFTIAYYVSHIYRVHTETF